MKLVYIDETGSVGPGARHQPYLTLVAAIVDESNVAPLAKGLEAVAAKHLGWVPARFEFHGNEIWQGTHHWEGKSPAELLAAYADLMALLDTCDVDIAHASIHKANLHARYRGAADENAYRLALQFLVEKVDSYGSDLKILIADESKDQQVPAVRMVAGMQSWSWGGEVPGKQLTTVIDTLHFVDSCASPGVQIADLVAYVIQRSRRKESHPDAQNMLDRLWHAVASRTRTYREPWP